MEPSREKIWTMFDQIAPTYDRVNRVMTFGIDQTWRKKMGTFLPHRKELKLLDCATGTADQLIALLDTCPHISEAVGIDLAADMLAIGRKKLDLKSYSQKATLQEASVLALPFTSESFDCVTISFGIRNATDVLAALKEMHRVLKPEGRLIVLEGSVPKTPLIRHLHLFYLRSFLPWIGGMISRKKEAYVYLNKTIETFPSGEAFCDLMREAGFTNVKANPLTFGAVTITHGDRST
jgi:demethylmenaquinone methyltransferase/2-methoxy-6-polyprenyl-1,4-benzoquinol methylase